MASRMLRCGRPTFAVSTQCASRVSACSAEFAWMVLRLPRWPVLSACSRSNASAPRTSPTRMRSGRCRSVARSRSAMVTAGSGASWPSGACARRASNRTQVRLVRGESRTSPRSGRCGRRSGMCAASALSSVVLPVPVPPEIRMFCCGRDRVVSVSRASRGGQRADGDQVVEAVPVRELPDRQRRARRPRTAGTSRPRASRPPGARRGAAAPRRSRRRTRARCS